MNINPELQRNIWFMSRERTIAMPVILAGILWVSYLLDGMSHVSSIGFSLLYFLLIFLGSWYASDAIFEELREHTWDAQRMTPLGPFTMTMGKLFGSTIYIWYGAGFCLLAIMIANIALGRIWNVSLYYDMAYYILAGIFSQSFAFFTALLFQRIQSRQSRTNVTFIRIFAILFGAFFFFVGESKHYEHVPFITWYDFHFVPKYFILATMFVFTAWLILGIYRLLRSELQVKSYPWDFLLFILFWIFYLSGFIPLLLDYYQHITKKFSLDWIEHFPKSQMILDNHANVSTNISTKIAEKTHAQVGNGVTIVPHSYAQIKTILFFSITYFSCVCFSYIAAFFTPKNIIYTMRLQLNIKNKQWLKALSLMPTFVLSLMLSALSLVFLIYFTYKQFSIETNLLNRMIGYMIALFLFLLRDIGILYYVTWSTRTKSPHFVAIVYLIILYTLMPMLLNLLGFPLEWMSIVTPLTYIVTDQLMDLTSVVMISLAILIQIMFVLMLLIKRWNAYKINVN